MKANSRLTVGALMQKEVVCVSEKTSLGELGKILLGKRVSGVPVVDGERRPIGIVSLSDIVDSTVNENQAFGDEKLFYRARTQRRKGAEGTPRGFHVERGLDTVEEIMTPLVVRVEADSSLRAAARLMVAEHVHRLIVVRDGKMVGIITAMDIVRAVASGSLRCAKKDDK